MCFFKFYFSTGLGVNSPAIKPTTVVKTVRISCPLVPPAAGGKNMDTIKPRAAKTITAAKELITMIQIELVIFDVGSGNRLGSGAASFMIFSF